MEGLNSFDIGFKSSWDHDKLSLTPLSEYISSRGLCLHKIWSFQINISNFKHEQTKYRSIWRVKNEFKMSDFTLVKG